ncbi:hypothetical protein LINPERPRIM_LOCUS21769 [Linum perenne]
MATLVLFLEALLLRIRRGESYSSQLAAEPPNVNGKASVHNVLNFMAAADYGNKGAAADSDSIAFDFANPICG